MKKTNYLPLFYYRIMNVNQYTYSLILIVLLSITMNSCKDIIAENISRETPEMITPTLNDTLTKNTVSFSWQEVSGATKYRLQIASPSFENITSYFLDSLISKTNIILALDSNQYEYKITAINAGYESQVLGPIRFWVGKKSAGNSTSSLVLSTPTNNMFVNKSFEGRFTWLAVDNGTNYEFELRKGGTFITGTNIYTMNPGNILDKTLSLNILPLSPGEYTWRVIANLGGTYLTQSIGKFTVDTLAPNQAALLNPANNSIINLSDSISFSWNNGTSNALFQSSVFSTVEIAADFSFSTIVTSLIVKDLQIKEIKLPTLISGNTYYWRVKNKDGAGNSALPSNPNKFLVN